MVCGYVVIVCGQALCMIPSSSFSVSLPTTFPSIEHACCVIRESVDSLSRDGSDPQYGIPKQTPHCSATNVP